MSKVNIFIEQCKTSEVNFTPEQISFLEKKLVTLLPKSRTSKKIEESESKEKTSTKKSTEKVKKQPNSYSVFTKEQTHKLIAEGFNNFKDRSTIISQRWKLLSDEEKAKFKHSI